ncbi:MAG: alpha-amylase family glycosyl hydrolase, partial [Aggregatilineales bacterium]
MAHQEWLEKQTTKTIKRLRPALEDALKQTKNSDEFMQRLEAAFPRLLDLLLKLYGDRYDFFYYLEKILVNTAQMFADRPADLRDLDRNHINNPDWFLSEKMLGMVCYVDLYAGDIAGLRKKLPFFKEMHITYLHLMPLFKAPETNNDGGYAISDYRTVNPDLGTMADLADFARELRENGISLTLDFVFNHTSNEHEWAQKAIAGNDTYRDYYHMYPVRTIPEQYEQTLREIFPAQAPGNFTYYDDIGYWVWTSFYDFQWDLNYKNPDVFNAMLGEMLFLANQGVEVLRLDAVAFIWKEMGTSCENLPQAHMIIQAYNALLKIVAPAMIFKSEAIVHPDDVMSYISQNECAISYNPTMMALIWESLATRSGKLFQYSMSKRYDLPDGCSWVNYVRVHDDIGWSFADE